VVLSDGARRYAVSITVGGKTLDAGLDSGSSGLRVLPGVLEPQDAEPGGRRSSYFYGSGARLTGVVGKARLAIGGASGQSSLELVQTVDCEPTHPHCPAARTPIASYGVQGDGLPGEGFKAILGVGMAEAEVNSPLPAIGVRRWIIELPLPGSGKPGRLVLNPTPDETSGYVAFPIDRRFADQRGGMHDSIPACLENGTTRRALCGAALLDTGAPGIVVINGPGAPWPDGTPAAVGFIDGSKVKTQAAFAIGRREFASRLTYEREGPSDVRLHLGLMPYFAWSALYDVDAGTVALKPRPDTAMTVR
jgi:hypothetical protein